MLRRNTRLSIAVMAAVMVATTACTSGTTGEPTPSSASASVEASPAFPSESVPPGVEKDSVLDLNSTKDMTGVVTTVSFADSPYAAHLPDICALIPNTAMKKLGVETKRLGFRGTQLISQSCNMQHLEAGDTKYNVTVNFFTNNFQEITNPARTVTVESRIPVANRIVGKIIKIRPPEPDNETFKIECGTGWGTFFGAIVVNFRLDPGESGDPCGRSVDAAQIVAPYMPKSPSEMRPAT